MFATTENPSKPCPSVRSRKSSLDPRENASPDKPSQHNTKEHSSSSASPSKKTLGSMRSSFKSSEHDTWEVWVATIEDLDAPILKRIPARDLEHVEEIISQISPCLRVVGAIREPHP